MDLDEIAVKDVYEQKEFSKYQNNDLHKLLPSSDCIESYFDRLWSICRSITGDGFRASLAILQELVPFELVETPSGTNVFDWTVPNEWNIRDAYIKDETGKKIVDFKLNNLHVVGYSIPVNKLVDLAELQDHLYSLPEQPDAIPYLTSYYHERWGFCLTETQRRNLKPGKYHVVIDSTLIPGHLSYGHLVLPSTVGCTDEILISTYLCHPSLANNELSGPLVTAFLYQCLQQIPIRKYNYRFIVVPETIGTIVYLAQHGEKLKENCRAGLVVTCCGDDKKITYKRSRRGNSAIDRCVEKVLSDYSVQSGKNYEIVDFSPLGSDERQYCSPGFNLPVGSLMRSMHGTYPEYHTSLDDKSFISFPGIIETIFLYLKVISSFEEYEFYSTTIPYCEPMLGPRGLYPTLGSSKETDAEVSKMMHVLNYCDGEHDLKWIAEKSNSSIFDINQIVDRLVSKGLLR